MSDEYLGPYRLGPNDDENCGIYTGDARELAKAIPDESVDLIFTDPVYDRIDDYRWLAETGARVLNENSACIAWAYTSLLPKVHAAMQSDLCYIWQIIWFKSNEVKYRYSPLGKAVYVPAVVYGKGKPRRPGFAMDLRSFPVWLNEHSNHEWSKPGDLFLHYIAALSGSDWIIFDPFTGGGTVPAVCKMLGRRYLAFEIDPDTAEMARERVRNTQPPLLIPEPEQSEMEL